MWSKRKEPDGLFSFPGVSQFLGDTDRCGDANHSSPFTELFTEQFALTSIVLNIGEPPMLLPDSTVTGVQDSLAQCLMT